jgi:hypothetical protein
MWVAFGFTAVSHGVWAKQDMVVVAVDQGYDLVGLALQVQ